MAWIPWNKLCLPKSEGGLGFRDIRCFNLALLAKQGWRLLMNPDSVLAQVYKACYFHSGELLTAPLGSRPSAAWRGIWIAREFLVKGLRYRIGNGSGASIWADPWIPEDCNFKIIMPRPYHSGFPYAVSDLIDPETRNWNVELISTHLWEVDKQRILQIPIGTATSRDRRIWHYSKNGAFSISSCYHMIFEATRRGSSGVTKREMGDGSYSNHINWSLVWRMKVPPKVKMFVWRAALNTLPHRAELFRRKITHSPYCEHCHGEEETTDHILQRCRGTTAIWQAPPFSLQQLGERQSFWAWLTFLRSSLASETYLLAVVVMWKLWEVRNAEVHDTPTLSSPEIIQWCQVYLESYWSAQTPHIGRHFPSTAFSEWSPPP